MLINVGALANFMTLRQLRVIKRPLEMEACIITQENYEVQASNKSTCVWVFWRGDAVLLTASGRIYTPSSPGT